MSLARLAAHEVLTRYNFATGDLREILENVYRQRSALTAPDKSFCRDLVNGVVGRHNTLDWALNRFSRLPVEQTTKSVRALLRLGAYQILYLAERVPAYAAVNESVAMAKKLARPQHASYVNAVLRSLERGKKSLPWPEDSVDTVSALSLTESHPPWLVKRWLNRLGKEQTLALLRKNNEVPSMSVRVNTLKLSRADLQERLSSEGMASEISPVSRDGLRLSSSLSLSGSESFKAGEFFVQDDASQLVTDLLDPQPGETVADLCAAPGGKCTHIAQRLQNTGTVLAFDTSRARLSLLTANSTRLGIKIVQQSLMDAVDAGKPGRAMADRVLVDAPCSALGIIRRHPDVRWNKKEDDVRRKFPAVQLKILKSAASVLKPGGVLVYSVCTTEPEENEDVLAEFRVEETQFEVESVQRFLPDSLQSAVTPEGYVRLWPHRHGTDGFFIARLRKRGETNI